MRVINNMRELKRLASRKGGFEGHIMLNFSLRSSKRIWLNGSKWTVFSAIDDTSADYDGDKELEQGTNIVRAMRSNALIAA